MIDHLQKARSAAEERFAQTQRTAGKGEKGKPEFAGLQAVREKTARLKALRLASEAAAAAVAAATPKPAPKARVRKKPMIKG